MMLGAACDAVVISPRRERDTLEELQRQVREIRALQTRKDERIAEAIETIKELAKVLEKELSPLKVPSPTPSPAPPPRRPLAPRGKR
jgi:hypothetical protein